jgi:hypothetical protein
MTATINVCLVCGKLPQIVPCYGGFAIVCDCPPAATYLSGGTVRPATRFVERSDK